MGMGKVGWIGAIAVAFAALVSTSGYVLVKRGERRAIQERLSLQVKREVLAEQRKAYKDVRRLEARLLEANELSEARKKELESELEAVKRAAAKREEQYKKARWVRASGGASRKARPKPRAADCAPGDPMCEPWDSPSRATKPTPKPEVVKVIADMPPPEAVEPDATEKTKAKPESSDKDKAYLAALAQVKAARAAHNAPDELRLGESAHVHLVVSEDGHDAELRATVKGSSDLRIGTIHVADVKVTPNLRAELTGGDFEIDRIAGKEVQYYHPDLRNHWEWVVKPEQIGNLELRLVLYAEILGDERGHMLKSYALPMRVHVTAGDRISSFLQSNWQWLWSALLVPVAGFLWARRRRILRSAVREAREIAAEDDGAEGEEAPVG